MPERCSRKLCNTSAPAHFADARDEAQPTVTTLPHNGLPRRASSKDSTSMSKCAPQCGASPWTAAAAAAFAIAACCGRGGSRKSDTQSMRNSPLAAGCALSAAAARSQASRQRRPRVVAGESGEIAPARHVLKRSYFASADSSPVRSSEAVVEFGVQQDVPASSGYRTISINVSDSSPNGLGLFHVGGARPPSGEYFSTMP